MAKSTRQYVFEGMELLPAALIPFVEKRLETSLKGHWQVQVLEKLPSLQTPAAEWLSDRQVWMLVSFFAEAIGSFALAYALTFLAAATKARRKRFPRIAMYLPVVGGVLVGMAAIGRGVGRAIDVSSYLDGPRTVASAQDIGLGSLSLVSEVIYYPASLALATVSE